MTIEKKSSIRVAKSENGAHHESEKKMEKGSDPQDTTTAPKTIIIKPGGISEAPPMLQPGRDGLPSNVHRCQEKWQNYIMYHFGDIGIFFTTRKYPLIEQPTFKESILRDKSGILKTIYIDNLKAYTKKKEKLREKKVATFAFMFGQMTEESKQVCARDPKYDEAILQQSNPLKLWNIIMRTHLSEQTGHSRMNRRVARKAYETLRQDEGETLLNFKRRYEDALKTLKASGESTPSDEDQAIDFLEKLDQNKFAEFGADLHNDAANKQEMGVPDTFPDTLAKMYACASRYKIVVNKGRTQTGGLAGTTAVFTTTIEELDSVEERPAVRHQRTADNSTEKSVNDERSGGNRTNKKNGGGNRGQQSEGENSRFPAGACLLCEEKGHKAFNCPMRDEVREFLKARQTDATEQPSQAEKKPKGQKSALTMMTKDEMEDYLQGSRSIF